MRATYRSFKHRFLAGETFPMDEAAKFASELMPNRLISISHSEAEGFGYRVIVWYWEGSDQSADDPSPGSRDKTS